ncbi:methyl-accepting chemotaxis protein [Cohnella endophytica]|uniref:Methyl-accepting chemotaxis protein n=1 Tax=Cohnella endophytica TaxID=2419778 RepID=A0A494XHD7_9BACL|nr:methyl-accepting chemotaxis protein [Cohnella endophytica]RKP48016.1 methyl-accepting chemotaxis protein [Cohnella endophytica]
MIGFVKGKKWLDILGTIQNQYLLIFMSAILIITIAMAGVSYSFSRNLITDGVNEKLKGQTHRYVNEIQGKLLSSILTPQALAPVAEANGVLGRDIRYSEPFLDETTGTPMVKASVPYYDDSQAFLGFAEQTIGLDELQQLVASIPVGRNGSAFLIDRTGMIISIKDYAKNMKQKLTEDGNKSLTRLAARMLAQPFPEQASDAAVDQATPESVSSESSNSPSDETAVDEEDTGDSEMSLGDLGLDIDLGDEAGTTDEGQADGQTDGQVDGQGASDVADGADVADVTDAVDSEAPVDTHIAADPGEAPAIAMNEGEGTYKQSGRTMRVYYATVPDAGWVLALSIPESELYGPLYKLLEPLSLIIVAACVLVAWMAHLYSRYILRNVKDINRLAIAMAEGDFTKRTQTRSGNELQALGDSFNRTLDGLCDTLQGISLSSLDMSSQANQMKSSAEETSRSAEEIASAIQSVTAGAEHEARIVVGFKDVAQEVLGKVKQINASTVRMTELAAKARKASEGGNESLSHVIKQMEEIHQAVQTSSGHVLRLKQHSNAIDEIVAFITSVASQTSLLSLNAAIEAARAGEAGRGFSVVSMEIRKLADQASQAAGEVSGLLSEIQGTIGLAAQTMEEGNGAVEAGIELARGAERSYGQIGSSIEKVTQQAEGVYESVRQIEAGATGMTASVKDMLLLASKNANDSGTIATAAEQQNASMQQVAAAAALLANLSQELKAKVQPFRIQ